MGKSLANQLGGGGEPGLLVCFERSERSVQGNNVLVEAPGGRREPCYLWVDFKLAKVTLTLTKGISKNLKPSVIWYGLFLSEDDNVITE